MHSPVLKYNSKYSGFDDGDFWYFIYGSILRKVFDVPADAKEIQFKAYKRPGKWRVKMELDGNHVMVDGKYCPLVLNMYLHAYELLQEHKTIYVECEYA